MGGCGGGGVWGGLERLGVKPTNFSFEILEKFKGSMTSPKKSILKKRLQSNTFENSITQKKKDALTTFYISFDNPLRVTALTNKPLPNDLPLEN